jgi:hypothetical protein
MKLFEYALHE